MRWTTKWRRILPQGNKEWALCCAISNWYWTHTTLHLLYRFAKSAELAYLNHLHHFKGKRYMLIKEWEVPAYLKEFDTIMKNEGMDSGSIQSYWKALCLLETCLSKTCTIPMIKEGYRISGLYPIDNSAILSGWSGWSLMTKEKAEEVISLLPTLSEIVKINGRLTDGEIEACMSHWIDFDDASRKSDDCAMNHGRCLWTNNGRVIATYKSRQDIEMRKSIDRDNRAIEKEWRLHSPERAASDDKKVRALSSGVIENIATQPIKRPRQYRCGNSSCTSLAPAAERSNWIRCRRKGCSLVFCTNCVDNSIQHISIFDKGVALDLAG